MFIAVLQEEIDVRTVSCRDYIVRAGHGRTRDDGDEVSSVRSRYLERSIYRFSGRRRGFWR